MTFQTLIHHFASHFPTIAGAPGYALEASSDSAVGQFPNHRNSVGFLPVFTCPGATWGKGGCGPVCYARHGRSNVPSVYEKQARNTALLIRRIEQEAYDSLVTDFSTLVAQANQQYFRRLMAESRTPRGKLYRRLKQRGPTFRFHWAGDLIHELHARAIRAAAEAFPDTSFWTYTRSFHLLRFLEPVPPNFTVWLSRDRANAKQADTAHRKHPWTRIAHMSNDIPGLVCPKYAFLPTDQACATCGICYQSQAREIVFPIKTYLTGEKPRPF